MPSPCSCPSWAVVTLSDPAAASFGVRLSGPDGPHVAGRLQTVMDLLAAGRLTLRSRTVIPLADAAGAHRALESHQLRAKVLLSVPA
jgi:NADPH:quinone reductase-like Zn-dependent oxidoreductase